MKKFDYLIKNGHLVDAAGGKDGRFDVGINRGNVTRVKSEIDPGQARQVYDATGKLVLPGLVDTHVHLTPQSRSLGFQMLARAGVTCALECGGFVEDVIESMAIAGSGISVAPLNRLDPGVSISGPNAGRQELSDYLDRSLADGALGLKILGGHHPLTPETTRAAIEVANAAGAYVAFHCGTTQNGSNLRGLLEALELADTNHLHVCHIPAYCRGLTHGSPVEEAMIALNALAAKPHLVSETYLGPYNGTSAQLENGRPRSHVTRTCLEMGGYDLNAEAMLKAADDGYMQVQKPTAREVIYMKPDEGAAYLKEMNFEATVSFPVNSRAVALITATEKDKTGRFIIPALATDGGGIPRNFLLSHGLSLVRFNALTLTEFVQKCCYVPAQMLGLPDKGHLTPGADADIVIVDMNKQEAVLTMAGGKVIMVGGVVTGKDGTIVTTEAGRKELIARGIPIVVSDLAHNLFYNAPELLNGK
ncbi:MAG: amidohydrolase family protein [Desulfobacterales bacterium]|nr:amidohydrolase family protein [Desulfobacterales bacterium]